MTWLDVPIGTTWISKQERAYYRLSVDSGINLALHKSILLGDLSDPINFDRFCGYLPPELV